MQRQQARGDKKKELDAVLYVTCWTSFHMFNLAISGHFEEEYGADFDMAAPDAQSAHLSTRRRYRYVLLPEPLLKYSSRLQTDKENQTELANYDAKVYKTSAQMADAIHAELRGMKIPFFVLRRDLIQGSSTSALEAKGSNASAGNETSKVSKAELLALQRRMLELLEDLCKE